jgi:c-di-GMP-related signal transduction protein
MIAAGALPEDIASKDRNPDSYLPDDWVDSSTAEELEAAKFAEETPLEDGIAAEIEGSDEKAAVEPTSIDEAEAPLKPFVRLSEIMRALREKGVANSLGRHIGFIRVNKAILLDKKIRSIPALKFALEVPLLLMRDEEVVKECEGLNRVKYQICLTDFDELFEGYTEILPLCKFVKLKLSEANRENLKPIIEKCHELEIKVVALDINTKEEFELAKEMGFDLFEGYFFCETDPEAAKGHGEKHLKLLKLLTLLLSNPELAALDTALSDNPTVAKHLIKIAEIEGKRKQRKVENVRDAVVLSGIKRITRWTQLLLYADNHSGAPLDSLPLLQLVCVRAFFMENAAGRLGAGGGLGSTDLAFLTGGLSLVETLFAKSSREILDQFNLPHVVVDAISDRSGFLGKLLEMAEASEQGKQERVESLCVDDLEPLSLQSVADDSLAAIRAFVQQTQEQPEEDEWPDAQIEESVE